MEESERSVFSTSRTFTIENTVEGDAGMYSCVATNDAIGGRDEEGFELYVQGKAVPKIWGYHSVTHLGSDKQKSGQ